MISKSKHVRIMLALIISIALLVGPTGLALGANPYCYINGQGWTTDQIVADETGFKTALDATANDQILVDSSEDSSGKYLNFGAFVDAVVGGNADPENPGAFQELNPVTPPAGDTVTVTAITDKEVQVGATLEVPVTTDPADAEIAALSSDEAVATATVAGSTITLTGVAAGTATITVGAAKEGYTAGSATFVVTVPEVVADSVASVSAVDGTVTVVMTTAPAVDPETGDFTVTMAIDGGEAAAVVPTNCVWTVDTKTAVLTVPAVTATAAVQSVVYTVAYKETAAKTADPFNVDALPPAATVTGVSAVIATQINVTGTNFTEANVADLATQLTLKNTATPTTTYAVSAPVYVSATEATMTCATIANTVTSVTWTLTPATGTAVTGTFAGETTKPTLSSVEALNATQLKVVFSEEMSQTPAVNVQNYTLYNIAAGKNQALTTGQSSAVLGSDKKTLTITLGGTDLTATAGMFGLNGFLPTDYLLYVDQSEATKVQDLAGNEVVQNSNRTFTGTTGVDTTAPVLTSSAYNTSTKQLVLTFNETVKIATANVVPTKVTVNGSAGSVTLVAGDYTGSGSDSTTVTFALTTASANAVAALTAPYTVALAAGAVKDSASNLNEVQNLSLTMSVPPALTAAAYDGVSHKLTLTFNKAVKPSSIISNIASITLARTGVTKALTTSEIVLTSANSETIEIQLANATYTVWESASVTSPTVSIASGKVQDTSSTALTNSTITNFAMTYTADSTALAPTTATYTESTGKLVLTFNKNLKTTATPVVADIALYNGTTKVFDLAAYTTAGTAAGNYNYENQNQLVFYLNAGGGNEKGAIRTEYEKPGTQNLKVQIKANAVEDTLSNKIALNEIATTYTDNVVPQVDTTNTDSVGSTSLKVVFNEKVDATTAVNLANYSVTKSDDTTVILTLSSPILMSDAKTVFFTTTPQQSITWKLTVTGIKDLAGNTISSSADNTDTFTASSAALTLISNSTNNIVDADSNSKLSSGDYLVLQFSKPISVKTTAGGADLRYNATNLDATTAADYFGSGYQVVKGEGPNEVKVIFGSRPSGYSTDILWAQAIVDATINNNSTPGTNIYAGSIDSAEYVTYAGGNANTMKAPTTATAPKIVSATFNDVDNNGRINEDDTIALTMTQPVTASVGATSTDDFMYDVDGTATSSQYAAADTLVKSVTASNSATVTIKLTSAATLSNLVPGTTKIDIKQGGTINLMNSWGVASTRVTTKNVGQEALSTDIAVSKSESTKPTLSSWRYVDVNANDIVDAGDIAVLKFSEPIQLYATMNGSHFVLSTSALLATTASDAIVSDPRGIGGYAEDELIITLATGANLFDGTTIQVSPSSLTKVRDANANALNTQTPITINAMSLGGTPATTHVVNNVTDLKSSAINSNVTTVVLGTDITLDADLVLNNGTKTLNLNGKTLNTGANDITITANDCVITNGTIAQAANAINIEGAGTGATIKNVIFTGTGALSNTATVGRTFENVSFGGNLTATKALTLKGVTWTADGTLTATENVTTSGDITIAATKTLTLTGAGGNKLIGSAGSEKVTGAGTLATSGTAIQVENLVIETEVSGVVASTVFKTVKFTPSSAKTITIDNDAEFDGVEWNSDATISVATAKTLALKGTISNGSDVTCAGTGMALMNATATVVNGIDGGGITATAVSKNTTDQPVAISFTVKGKALAANKTMKLAMTQLTMADVGVDQEANWILKLANADQAANVKTVTSVAGTADPAYDATVTWTGDTGTVVAGAWSISHLNTTNKGFATTANVGTSDGRITINGISTAFTMTMN